jgi:hypothetical protein
MFDLDFNTKLELIGNLLLGFVIILFLIYIIFYFIIDYKDIIIKEHINCEITNCLFSDTDDVKYYFKPSIIMLLLGIKTIGLDTLGYKPGTKINIKYNKYNNEIYTIKWYKDK